MVSEAELVKRRDVYFRKNPIMPIHQEITITEHDARLGTAERSCKMMVGWLVSMDGFRHAFILAPIIELDFALLLRDGCPMKQLNSIVDGVEMTWGNQNALMDDRGNLKTTPFTNRVYIFTSTLREDRNHVKRCSERVV